MANLIKTKRGLDIVITGEAKEITPKVIISEQITVVPDHYHSITPKVVVKEGDTVKAGTPLFYNKAVENMNFVSPVSGKVVAVTRGERRKVLGITIACDKEIAYESFTVQSPSQADAEEIKNTLLASGLWAYIKQRPYDVIANPAVAPKAVFVSGFDSAPLAPDHEKLIAAEKANFQTGIDVLAKLAGNNVQLGVKEGSTFYNDIKNVEITAYSGPHPVGNVGIQINHTSPVNKGEIVWTVNAQDVLFIGRLFNTGKVDLKRKVALTGPEVTAPAYYETIAGTSMGQFVDGKVKTGNLRYISGNVLTGLQTEVNGTIDPYATQVTVIKEGNDVHELFGWGMPRFNKFSVSSTYFTGIMRLFGKKDFDYDTRLMGGKRAIIMSNEYDKVLPMDIYPEFLFKAMITGNIEKMEALGAYEIAPEDVALCEFVCTSKLPLQQIVRDALDVLRKEVE